MPNHEMDSSDIWKELAEQSEKIELKPEQKADLVMAAQLNELVRDYDNASILYKQAGEKDLAEENRSLAAASVREKGSSKINPHLENLVKKIARWLTVRQKWNTLEQQRAFERIRGVEYGGKSAARKDQKLENLRDADIVGTYASFSLGRKDPDYEALFQESDRKVDNIVQEQLGVPIVRQKKRTGNPNETIYSGLELTTYGDNSLILKGSEVQIWKKDSIETKNL